MQFTKISCQMIRAAYHFSITMQPIPYLALLDILPAMFNYQLASFNHFLYLKAKKPALEFIKETN